MWPFLAFGGLFAAGGTFGRPGNPPRFLWIGLFLITVVFVGLRHHVGMDWNNYLRMIYAVSNAPTFFDIFRYAEPLYAMLLWIGVQSGWGIYATNLIAAFLTMGGIFAFAKRTHEPWLALMAALPLLITVISMTANRQATAVGVLMLFLAHWHKLSVPVRVLAVFVCAGFHASALVFLAFIVVDLRLPNALKVAGMVLFAAMSVYVLQSSGFAAYYDQAYGSGQSEDVQSSGAIFHVGMTAFPALFYLVFGKFKPTVFPQSLLRNMSIAAVLTLLIIPFASAAAGRISFYWFPVAMWVIAAIPSAVDPKLRRIVRFLISGVMMLIMFGWLMFANSAVGHIPYLNALFVDSWLLEILVLP